MIAIASSSTSSILLYDLRNYDKPPFATFDLRRFDTLPHVLSQASLSNGSTHHSPISQAWTKLEFSNDGKSILLGTNNSLGHLLLDAFDGDVRAFLVRPSSNLPLNPSNLRVAPYPPSSATPPSQGDITFTADGRYLIGSSGGEHDAVIWDTQGEVSEDKVLKPMAVLPQESRMGVVEWNPRYNMMVSADREVVFWLPDEHVRMKAV